ncbi:putative signaling protein [Tepidimonas thermarum]|uniref:Putative signaling protein n=1 Tax=Tepidimonas thermarum TaxID=335431 RepID=A0A554WX71_9BURK|nr:EAL domain-containing protein [Tepidimonas thermarum]TSE28182.1 putative signaling protein [Tepidimonas thermarum]
MTNATMAGAHGRRPDAADGLVIDAQLREALAEVGGGLDAARVEHALLTAAPDGILLVDARGTILLANPAVQALTGHAPQQLVGQPLDVLMPAGLMQRHRQRVEAFFSQPHDRPMGRVPNLRLRHRDGHEVPVDIALGVCEVAGTPCAAVFLRDVTELQRLTEVLRHQATHDPLTGLYNRAQLLEVLRLACQQAQRGGRPGAVLLVDLDDFKAINDGHGHATGDRLLIEVARRLRSTVRAMDVVARLGGDEFVIVLPEVAGADAALAVGEKLLHALAQPYQLDALALGGMGASAGVAVFPHDACAPDDLLRFADVAMYAAKHDGRGGVARFEASMAASVDAHLRVHERLQHALRHGGLQLHYQPQFDWDAERVTTVEALLRWSDPVLGAVSPQRCIEVAEATGLIVSLGDWVLEQACRQARQWRDQGAAVRVAVNLSPQQFRLPDLPQRIVAMMQRHGLPGEALELEITESHAMADPQRACVALRQLMEHGIELALDDFGTGHSSLAQLKRLPLHRLKIDREFVRGIPHDGVDAALVRGVARLARLLRLQTVAEGVETATQAWHVRRHGVDAIQGWVLDRAQPAHEVARWFGPQGAARALARLRDAAPAMVA